MAKLFITGVSGFLGYHLIPRLLKNGYSITAWVRSKNAGDRLEKIFGIDYIVGSFSDLPALVQASQNSSAIINLVGAINETKNQTFEDAHIIPVQQLIAAAKINHISRFIHISALGARIHARSRYHHTKYQAEELLRQSGLDFTILRPSFIFGKGNHTEKLLQRLTSFPLDLLQLYTFPCFGDGNNLLQPIHVDDVCEAIVRCLAHPDSIKKTIDLPGSEKVPFATLLVRTFQSLGKHAEFDRYGIKTILRHLHWAGTFLIALILIFSLVFQLLPLSAIVILLLIEILLLRFLLRAHSILIFPIPIWLVKPIFLILHTFSMKYPIIQPPIGIDALLMLEEDNIGDPSTYQKLLNLSPRPFSTEADLPSPSAPPLHRPLKKIYA
ncbi:MAG: NAD-dependent epimerase/dehydratase family protein [Methylacidiphilales bacterium]|nr:NAD-dependent epimerase/dehydratase family protein [Candidatus Methylacidiphilales bacterium]MDW8349535.1 NAD-dependent epimerase/dehydratase family protein [Verrucomicrobiae bacterium]